MKYTQSNQFKSELQNISDVLELINYRTRTIESYLQSIFECCQWLKSTYDISLDEASVIHLRKFLLYLIHPKAKGGRALAPSSVNVYNCAIKKYSRFVLRKPLSNEDLPLCKVDRPLPKVPSKKDAFTIIREAKNIKHKAILAMAYGGALRLKEVCTLRCGDVSFGQGTITISAEVSKSRYAGVIELPERLKEVLRQYYWQCCRGAKPDDWLFPGQKPGAHISTQTAGKVFHQLLAKLGWETRGYTFHSLRHAHALHYYQAGADLFQVQQRLRHRTITSTLVYVRLDAELKVRKHIENPFDDPGYSIW